jgi:hypothetical protein
MKYLKHLLPTCLLLSLSTLSGAAAAIPADPPPQGQSGQTTDAAGASVRLTTGQSRHFQSAFQAIAKQAHVCILAEDAPIQSELPERGVSLPTGSTPTAESLIKKVAAAYDYTVEHAGPSGSAVHQVFLLRKRFTGQNDLPDVTFDECRIAFAQIAGFIHPFKPQPPTGSNTNTVLDIADALSEQQLRQMASGGIPIRSLSPSQRQLVWRLALHMYVRLNTGMIEESGPYLDKVQKQGFAKRGLVKEGHPDYGIWQGQPAYGVELPGSTDPIQTFTLCCPVSESANLNSPGIMVEENPLGDVGEAKPAPGTETLDGIVADLARLAPGNTYSLDPVVAERRVSRFGVPYAPPAAQIEALATLLDQRFLHRTEDAFELGRPDVPRPRDVTELFTCVRAAVPAPIRRFVGVEPPPPPGTSAEFGPHRTDVRRRDHASAGGGIARLQMRPALIAALGGEEHADEHKTVRFSTLDERTRSRFAFYWIQEWLTSRLLDVPAETPEYISRFPDALLTGG